MVNIIWFQLLKCDHLLFFFDISDSKLNICRRHSILKITLGSEIVKPYMFYFLIFHYFSLLIID